MLVRLTLSSSSWLRRVVIPMEARHTNSTTTRSWSVCSLVHNYDNVPYMCLFLAFPLPPPPVFVVVLFSYFWWLLIASDCCEIASDAWAIFCLFVCSMLRVFTILIGSRVVVVYYDSASWHFVGRDFVYIERYMYVCASDEMDDAAGEGVFIFKARCTRPRWVRFPQQGQREA